MTTEQHVKALRILQYYKADSQYLKCVEELSELTEAIMKHINKGNNKDAIFEEIVDVEIMLEQVKILLPQGENVFSEEIDRKLDRQLRRIKEQA